MAVPDRAPDETGPAVTTPSTYNAIAALACRVNTTWCQPPSFQPAVLETTEVAPMPATIRPSDRSETPKSPVVPVRSALNRPEPEVQDVPVPRPWVDLNHSSTEKSLVAVREAATWSLTPSS